MQGFDFDGVLTPVLTPFTATLTPDTERFVTLCRQQLDQGAAGLAVFGTTGEANSLTTAERIALLDALCEAGIDPAKLMPGTGHCALPDAVALTRHAVERGCGGVLVLPPFYYPVGDAALHAYYCELIDRVGDARLKLYLYHIPQLSGVPITPDLLERLRRDRPNAIAGIKDSSGNWDNTKVLLERFPDLAVYPSSEAQLLEARRLGAAGCISASANVNVAAIAELAARWQDDDAEALQKPIAELRQTLEKFTLIPALKLIIAHYRDDPAWLMLRPPLSPLATDDGAALLGALNALDYRLTLG